MSRNLLPETTPEGVDDQTWFYLHETLRKYDAAISRLDAATEEALNSTSLVKPKRLSVFCAPGTPVLVPNAAGTKDSGVVTFGEAGGGDVEAVVAGFPGGAETQAWLSSPDGSVNSGVRLTFGAAPGTMAASSVVVRLYSSVPVGFTAWDTVALELDYGFAISGASPGSSAFVALGMLGDTDDIGTVATFDEVGGSISKAYSTGPSLKITKAQIAAAIGAVTFTAGAAVVIRISFATTSTSGTGSVLDLGKLRINWR